jgi:transposase
MMADLVMFGDVARDRMSLVAPLRGDFRPVVVLFLLLQTDSSHCGQNLWNADEIVGRSGEHEEPLHQGAPAMTGLAHLLASIRSLYPWLRHIFADGGYAGEKLRKALKRMGEWTIEIIKRSDTAQGFEVLPRRWVVERTFAWLGRCRRLAKDFEATIASAVAWALVAHIRILTRRLARA